MYDKHKRQHPWPNKYQSITSALCSCLFILSRVLTSTRRYLAEHMFPVCLFFSPDAYPRTKIPARWIYASSGAACTCNASSAPASTGTNSAPRTRRRASSPCVWVSTTNTLKMRANCYNKSTSIRFKNAVPEYRFTRSAFRH